MNPGKSPVSTPTASSLCVSAASKETAAILVIVQSIYLRDPRVRRAVLALTQAGYSVDVICQAEQSKAKREQADGAYLYNVPIQRQRGGAGRYILEYLSFLIAALVLTARLHMRRRYKLVYVNNMPDVLVFAALVPKLCGARVILDVHDPFPEMLTVKFGASSQHRLVRAAIVAERLSHRFADRIITVHDGMRHLLARSTAPSKIVVVMNVAPVERFASVPPNPPADRFVVTYIGTIAQHYGLDLALDALHLVRQAAPTVLLRIVGEGPHEAHLHERIAAEHLDGMVEFVGVVPMEQIPRVLAESHCGICPVTGQVWDTMSFPNKVYEYVASGLPAVIPRTRLLDTYYPDDAVIFYRPDDAEDLAIKLIAAHRRGPALRGDLLHGREKVLKMLNWPVQQEALLQCVSQALAD